MMKSMQITFHLRILTPAKTIFEGEVQSVSSVNSAGPFDILAEHANFITLVEDKDIKIIKADKQLLTFKFAEAIIFNADSKVAIYADPQLG